MHCFGLICGERLYDEAGFPLRRERPLALVAPSERRRYPLFLKESGDGGRRAGGRADLPPGCSRSLLVRMPAGRARVLVCGLAVFVCRGRVSLGFVVLALAAVVSRLILMVGGGLVGSSRVG